MNNNQLQPMNSQIPPSSNNADGILSVNHNNNNLTTSTSLEATMTSSINNNNGLNNAPVNGSTGTGIEIKPLTSEKTEGISMENTTEISNEDLFVKETGHNDSNPNCSGEKKTKRNRLTVCQEEELKSAICNEYNNGVPLQAIQKKYGLTKGKFKGILGELTIEKRLGDYNSLEKICSKVDLIKEIHKAFLNDDKSTLYTIEADESTILISKYTVE